METTKQLITYISQWNPWALSIITSNSFMRYNRYQDMLLYMIKNNIIWSVVREECKDVFLWDVDKYAKHIQQSMIEDEMVQWHTYKSTATTKKDNMPKRF